MGLRSLVQSWLKRNPAVTTPIEREWLHATWTYRELGAVTAKRPREDQRTLVLRAAGYVNICASLIADYCGTVPIRLYQKRTRRSEKPKAEARRKYRRLCDPFIVGVKASMYAERAGDVEEVEDSDALAFIRNPNGNDTGHEFWTLHRWYKCITGNAYWLVASQGGAPVSMRHMLPQNTAILPGKTGRLIDGYAYGREQTNIEVFQPEDVLHFKLRPSPFDPYYGVGRLHAITVEADVLTAARNLDLIGISNYMIPPAIIQMPRGTSPDQQKQMYDRLYSGHRGPNNKQEPLITVGDEIKITMLAQSAKEAETDLRDKRVRKIVWDSFGMCGMLDESGASLKIGSDGKSDAERMFLRQTCNPILVGDAEAMTIGLLPKFGISPGDQWFAADDACGEDEAALEVRMVALTNAALLTTNEARERIGYEPVADGDALRYAGTSLERLDAPPVPFSGGGFGDEPEGDGIGSGRVPAEDDSSDGEDSDEARGKGRGRTPELPSGGVQTVSTRSLILGNAECPHEGCNHKTLPEIIPGEDAIQAAVGKWVRNIPASVTEAGLIFDAAKVAELFTVHLGDKLIVPMAAGYDAGSRVLGGRGPTLGSFAIENPTAVAAVRGHTIRLSRHVTATVQSQLQNAIAAQIESGAPLTELQDTIRATLGNIDKYGAERIARTETARGYSLGSIKSWEDSGVVVGKKWELAPGACPLCEAAAVKFNAKTVPLNQPFAERGSTIVGTDGQRYLLDYSDIDGPPLHPNDRCGLGPVLEGDV